MAYLADNGYNVVPLAFFQEKDFLDGKIPPKTVAITFDDGYKDFLEHAFPVLEEFNFPSTQFIATGWVGKAFNGRTCLGWEDIRDLSRKNVTFGSHTATHPKLHGMPDIEIEKEVAVSKFEIESRLGIPISTFAYPYAFPQEDFAFVKRMDAILRNVKFRVGVTTRIGRHTPSENPLFVRRVPANTHDDADFFQAKLEGGYDWLSSIQYVKRYAFKTKAGSH
jgi:peptidoglycan/xylan/chitin deacetylase (PgdA/CDA1 family)